MAKKYHSRVYKIVFIRAGHNRKIPGKEGTGAAAGRRSIRHRQDEDDGFKTSCGIDLLNPPRISNGTSSYPSEIKLIGATTKSQVCPACAEAIKTRWVGKAGALQVLTDAEIWKAARFYHKYHWTLAELAAYHKVGIGTMHKYFKDRGIKRRKKLARNPEAVRLARLNLDWREAVDISYLYESGNSVETVAFMMGMTPGKLTRRMKEYGITIRPKEEQQRLAKKNRTDYKLTPEGREKLRQSGLRSFYERTGVFKHSRFDHYYEDDQDEPIAA